MIKINPLADAESIRQQRNMTHTQKRAEALTKEGVVVNTFVKDPQSMGLSDTYNNMIISDSARMPSKLYEPSNKPDKSFIPVMAVSLGVMSAVALFSAFVKRNAKIAINIAKEKWMPTITRNVNLSDELTQIVYQLVQNPSRTTIVAATGVLALSSMAFMGKTFLDGYKDIGTKRKEADIHKSLQENLISVETQSFSGKMQIIRSMLSNRAKEFDKYLNDDKDKILPNFGRQKFDQVSFTSKHDDKNSKKNALSLILLGLGSVASIIVLGFYAYKNASKSRAYIEKYLNDTKKVIKEVVKTSTKETKADDMEQLENLFKIVDAEPDYIKSIMRDVKWDEADKNSFIENTISKIKTSTTKVNPNIGGDGTAKPAFNSFVSDYRAFFYNWLLDTSNPQFKQLFFGVTGVTAASYIGKLLGDAIKDVQVKKINAETELELQKRLVSTELRNFKAKKDAAIQPLVDEFYRQVDAGKSKTELKIMAENILFEIKNGAPFVYS